MDGTMSFNCPYYKQKKVGNVGETLSRGHRENTIPASNVQYLVRTSQYIPRFYILPKSFVNLQLENDHRSLVQESKEQNQRVYQSLAREKNQL